MKKVIILIVLMLGCVAFESKAQKIALKSNLLYDATTTMNLGLTGTQMDIGCSCEL